MPVLGIFASQITGKLYTPTGSMYHIASTTVGTAVATVDFGSIPADYTHLQIRVMTQDTRNTPVNRLSIRVGNGSIDTGSNYSYHYMQGNGSATEVSADTSVARIPAGYSNSATTLSSTYGVGIWDILDYANTNKKKTVRILSGCDLNGSGEVGFASGGWYNTAAIDTIQFFSNNAGNLSQYSTFSLYGVK